MGLDQQINVSISTATRTPTRAGFGTPLIVAFHSAWADFVREYGNPSEMLEDGFTTGSWAYLQAQMIKSQDPSVKTFKVGRRETAPVRTIELTPVNVTEGFVYQFRIGGKSGVLTEIEYTVPNAATVASVITALQALVDAVADIAAADDTTTMTITASVDGDPIYFAGLEKMVKTGNIAVEDVTADPGLAADMAKIVAEDSDFYGVCLDSTGAAEIAVMAAWAEARDCVYLANTLDTDCLDAGVTDCVMSTLAAAEYANTTILYSADSTAGGGWLGVMLWRTPGSATWSDKQIRGLTASQLTTGQQSAIEGKSGNHYTDTGGLNITFQGWSSAGEYTDIVRGIDWTKARIKEGILAARANNPKIPYTEAGIGILEGVIGQVLRTGVKNGLYAADPAPRVFASAANDVPANVRATRHLPSMSFTARLAGAIHTLDVTGTVSA